MKQEEMRNTRVKGNGTKEKVIEFCQIHDIDMSFIQPWHMRLSKDEKPTIDVYPRKCTTFHMETRTWKTHWSWEGLEKYLTDQLNN